MQGDLGKSQLSSLLETVPGLASVLRSPVADAIVNMVRAGAGLRDFDISDAKELVQYATRRGLIPSAEGSRLLEEVKGAGRKGRAKPKVAKKKAAKTKAAKKAPVKKTAKTPPAKKIAKKAVKKAVKKTAPKKTQKTVKKKTAKKTTGKSSKSRR